MQELPDHAHAAHLYGLQHSMVTSLQVYQLLFRSNDRLGVSDSDQAAQRFSKTLRLAKLAAMFTLRVARSRFVPIFHSFFCLFFLYIECAYEIYENLAPYKYFLLYGTSATRILFILCKALRGHAFTLSIDIYIVQGSERKELPPLYCMSIGSPCTVVGQILHAVVVNEVTICTVSDCC